MRFFEKYLSVWVALCIVFGVAVGYYFPSVPQALSRLEVENVSLPTAILIWTMIYPMMLKIDFQSIGNIRRHPGGIALTLVVNWLVKPFSMFGIAWAFFFVVFGSFIEPSLADEYLAGSVLLGAAPCTAMVFVWSSMTRGDAAYTLVQVAANDLMILAAFAPTVGFLLNVGGVTVPWSTLAVSVVLFVLVPLCAAAITRVAVIRFRGRDFLERKFVHKFDSSTSAALLLTIVLLFSFQGRMILSNPLHIILIAVPLTIQTLFVFSLAYVSAKVLRLPHKIAAPAGMIGASNFFELAVATAVSVFGLDSGAALATVVGVLVEVPLMLFLVSIANRTRRFFR